VETLPLHVSALDRDLLGGVLLDPELPESRHRLDVGVLPYFEDERPLQGLAGFVDWRTGGLLSGLLRRGFCSGRSGEAVLLPGGRNLPARRWVLLGLGRSSGFGEQRAHESARAIVSVVMRLRPEDVLMAMPGRVPERAAVEEVFRGLTAGLHAHTREPKLETGPAESRVRDLGGGPSRWWVVAESRHVARLRRLLEGPPRAAGE
jgi:hypothetical protein